MVSKKLLAIIVCSFLLITFHCGVTTTPYDNPQYSEIRFFGVAPSEFGISTIAQGYSETTYEDTLNATANISVVKI